MRKVVKLVTSFVLTFAMCITLLPMSSAYAGRGSVEVKEEEEIVYEHETFEFDYSQCGLINFFDALCGSWDDGNVIIPGEFFRDDLQVVQHITSIMYFFSPAPIRKRGRIPNRADG